MHTSSKAINSSLSKIIKAFGLILIELLVIAVTSFRAIYSTINQISKVVHPIMLIILAICIIPSLYLVFNGLGSASVDGVLTLLMIAIVIIAILIVLLIVDYGKRI